MFVPKREIVTRAAPQKDDYAETFALGQVAARLAEGKRNETLTFRRIHELGVAAAKEQQPQVIHPPFSWAS